MITRDNEATTENNSNDITSTLNNPTHKGKVAIPLLCRSHEKDTTHLPLLSGGLFLLSVFTVWRKSSASCSSSSFLQNNSDDSKNNDVQQTKTNCNEMKKMLTECVNGLTEVLSELLKQFVLTEQQRFSLLSRYGRLPDAQHNITISTKQNPNCRV
jgi:hypothetical protein